MEQSFDRAVDDEVGRPQGGKHRRVTGERLARSGRADRQRPGLTGVVAITSLTRQPSDASARRAVSTITGRLVVSDNTTTVSSG